jgi:hypothetical protein
VKRARISNFAVAGACLAVTGVLALVGGTELARDTSERLHRPELCPLAGGHGRGNSLRRAD